MSNITVNSRKTYPQAAPCSFRELASPVKQASPSFVCTKIKIFLPSDAFSEVSSLFVAFQTHCTTDTQKNATTLSIKHYFLDQLRVSKFLGICIRAK